MMGPLLVGIYVFVLAIFVGVEIITKIPPTLHTPLMSGANAISGITIVGAVIAAGVGEGAFAIVLGFLAFGEVPDVWTWIGGVVIFASTSYISYRESRVRAERQA